MDISGENIIGNFDYICIYTQINTAWSYGWKQATDSF